MAEKRVFPARMFEWLEMDRPAGGWLEKYASGPVRYRVRQLDGVPEGGNSSHIIDYEVGGARFTVRNLDGWGQADVLTYEGKHLGYCDMLGSPVAGWTWGDLDNAGWIDYATKISGSAEIAAQYMCLEGGWQMVNGALVCEPDEDDMPISSAQGSFRIDHTVNGRQFKGTIFLDGGGSDWTPDKDSPALEPTNEEWLELCNLVYVGCLKRVPK